MTDDEIDAYAFHVIGTIKEWIYDAHVELRDVLPDKLMIVGFKEDEEGSRCGLILSLEAMESLTPEQYAAGFLDTWHQRYPIYGWGVGNHVLL